MFKFISFIRAGVFAALMLLTGSFIFVSCVKNHNNDTVNTAVAGLMSFNLSPDQPAVNFSISGNSLTNVPLGYSSYTGTYQSIYPGVRTIDAFDFNAARNKISSADGNFVVGKYYSVFLTGADSNYHTIIVNDQLDSIAAVPGKALVRYVNGIIDSVSAPTVTVSAGGNTLINNPAAFSTVSSFTSVPAGDIIVTAKNANGIDVSRTITVQEKTAYTILLVGVPGSATTPVEIKYIANGLLSDSTNKAAISAQPAISN